MTDTKKSKPSPPSDAADTRHAKGAARATIGKLLGDDDEVRKGRAEQRSARADSAADTTDKS